MNERLLDDVVYDMDKHRVDSEYIRDQFVEVGQKYVNQADDPTVENVEVLIEHFEDRNIDEIGEEALSMMWVMRGILQWMVDDLPLQGQTNDPAWLRQQLEVWEQIWGPDGKPNSSSV